MCEVLREVETHELAHTTSADGTESRSIDDDLRARHTTRHVSARHEGDSTSVLQTDTARTHLLCVAVAGTLRFATCCTGCTCSSGSIDSCDSCDSIDSIDSCDSCGCTGRTVCIVCIGCIAGAGRVLRLGLRVSTRRSRCRRGGLLGLHSHQSSRLGVWQRQRLRRWLHGVRSG